MSRLTVESCSVDYGNGDVVKDVGFTVDAGQILVILGPNGAGKSTLLRSVAGLVPTRTGSVVLDGTDLSRAGADRRSRAGLLLVPEGRGLFPGISVEAHITLAGRKRAGRGVLREIGEFFPALTSRWKLPAGALSGGEAQMLAMAMALVAEPSVLLVDELSFGLAPLVVRDMLGKCRELADERGIAIVLVEQYMDLALDVADHAILLRREVLRSGTATELAADRELISAEYFGGLGV